MSDHRLGAGLSGVDTARELSRRAGRSVPTLILTGDTGAGRISDIASSGFAIIHKTIDADALRGRLTDMMLR